MKTIYKLMLCLGLSLFSKNNDVKAQVVESQIQPLSITGTSYNGRVLLRWLASEEVFQAGQANGYTLYRYKHADANGNVLSDSISYLTRIVLAEEIKYEGLGTYNLNTDSQARALDSLLKYSALPTSSIANPRLSDAVLYSRKKEFKYLFTMMILDQRFDLAKTTGLGFVDNTSMENGVTYRYEIRLRGSYENKLLTASGFVKFQNEILLHQIQDLSGYGEDKKAILSWDISTLGDKYTYFDIYRSDNGGTTFTKRNKAPFMYMPGDEALSKRAFYGDSLVQNNLTYKYKIKGISPFGFQSDFSNTIEVKGIPPRLKMQLVVDSMYFTNNNLTILWQNLAPVYGDSLLGFDIYMRKTFDDKPVKINASLLPPSQRSYSTPQVLQSAYYYLQAEDQYGRIYHSINYLGQVKDSIPPESPTELNGFISSDAVVSLEWATNTEADLDGYLVYFSNGVNTDFTSVTPKVLKTPKFSMQLQRDFNIDSIFFKVCAVDHRFNRSPMSEIIALQRPDIFGPAKPIITQLIPRPEGLRIGWQIGSEDNIKYWLQRKRTNTNIWQNVINFSNGEDMSIPAIPEDIVHPNFLDDAELSLAPYHYRLLAKDAAGNESSSNIYTVTPYDDGIRGNISALQATFVTYMMVWQPNAISSGTASGQVVKVPGKAGRLHWQYSTEFPSSLQSFKIYRKTPSSMNSPSGVNSNNSTNEYTLIKTIPVAEAKKQAEILSLSGYAYYDTVINSEPGQVKYKVISYHSDGGQSNWTQEVALIFPH